VSPLDPLAVLLEGREQVRLDPRDDLRRVLAGEFEHTRERTVTAIECESAEALRHSLGLRVWVVRWIAESTNGTVTVSEDDGETELVVTVPTIAPPAA